MTQILRINTDLIDHIMNIRIYIPLLILMGFSGYVHAISSDTLTVRVLGTSEDARFEPRVIQAQPGDVIKFVVVEGLHTVTAYHPQNRRPQRIPENAVSFDSGMLTEGDIWFLEPNVEGVYDYFCLPHERMGHSGRLLVGEVTKVPAYPLGRIAPSIIEDLDTETKLLIDQNSFDL